MKIPSDENQSEDDIAALIRNIREKLEESPAAIFPFFESCSEIINLTIENNADKWILEWDASTTYKARTQGGSFEATGSWGYARAAEIMNSKSSNDFRWCLKITGRWFVSVGIASTLQLIDEYIHHQDENSLIFWCSWSNLKGKIFKGKTVIKEGIDAPFLNDKREFEIRCRFQPKLKKFSFLFGDEEYDCDIKEDIDYFPVIQGYEDASAALIKP